MDCNLALFMCGERWDVKNISTLHMIQPYVYLTPTTVLYKCDKPLWKETLWKETMIPTVSERGDCFIT